MHCEPSSGSRSAGLLSWLMPAMRRKDRSGPGMMIVSGVLICRQAGWRIAAGRCRWSRFGGTRATAGSWNGQACQDKGHDEKGRQTIRELHRDFPSLNPWPIQTTIQTPIQTIEGSFACAREHRHGDPHRKNRNSTRNLTDNLTRNLARNLTRPIQKMLHLCLALCTNTSYVRIWRARLRVWSMRMDRCIRIRSIN